MSQAKWVTDAIGKVGSALENIKTQRTVIGGVFLALTTGDRAVLEHPAIRVVTDGQDLVAMSETAAVKLLRDTFPHLDIVMGRVTKATLANLAVEFATFMAEGGIRHGQNVVDNRDIVGTLKMTPAASARLAKAMTDNTVKVGRVVKQVRAVENGSISAEQARANIKKWLDKSETDPTLAEQVEAARGKVIAAREALRVAEVDLHNLEARAGGSKEVPEALQATA